MFKIKGVIVPLLTLFDPNGQLDTNSLRLLVDFLIERGVHGLFPAGTTGEGPLLTVEERQRLAEVVVEAAAGRVPVVVHTGAISTEQSIAFTRHAQTIGAQAAALIPPYYFHYSNGALLRHFERVAREAPDFPIYLYNNPAVTGHRLSAGLIEQLLERCPNIIGIKDSSGSLDVLARGITWRNGAFNTANGSDALFMPSLALGVDACVSGNANVVPELAVRLYEAMRAGDLDTARTLQMRLNDVRGILRDGADLALFKGILARRGLSIHPSVRAPLPQAADGDIALCWEALTALDLELIPL